MPVKLPEINLLPKYKRQRPGKSYIILISMILALLLLLFVTIYFFIIKHQLKTAEKTYNLLNQEIETLEIKNTELSADDPDEISLAQAVNFAENLYIPTSVFISELKHLLPDHSYLSEYSYESHQVQLEAHFETLDMVADYTASLNRSPYIIDAKVDQVETFSLLEQENHDDSYQKSPRYEAHYTLTINQWKLREAAKTHE